MFLYGRRDNKQSKVSEVDSVEVLDLVLQCCGLITSATKADLIPVAIVAAHLDLLPAPDALAVSRPAQTALI